MCSVVKEGLWVAVTAGIIIVQSPLPRDYEFAYRSCLKSTKSSKLRLYQKKDLSSPLPSSQYQGQTHYDHCSGAEACHRYFVSHTKIREEQSWETRGNRHRTVSYPGSDTTPLGV